MLPSLKHTFSFILGVMMIVVLAELWNYVMGGKIVTIRIPVTKSRVEDSDGE